MPRPSSVDILPHPFTWIDIPAGKVTLVEIHDDESYFGKKGEQKVFDVPSFAIAKYPLTNAQYGKFVDARGYDQRRWWTDEGWEAKEQNNWTEPRFWHDETWNKADYPVVAVSWFEAIAFCLWLNDKTGENIMLPTEQQWQRAAQGDTNWAYPWGDEFDRKRCNCRSRAIKSVTQYIGVTTSVTRYEGMGDSPFKVVDMSGNVQEWCLTDFHLGTSNCDTHANSRVQRGGSCVYEKEHVRVDSRDLSSPLAAFNTVGFRIVRS